MLKYFVEYLFVIGRACVLSDNLLIVDLSDILIGDSSFLAKVSISSLVAISVDQDDPGITNRTKNIRKR